MRTKLLLGTALALLPLVSASGESLEEAQIKAYMTNPTLAAERAQLRATDEGLPQAIALRRPTITGQGEAGIGVTDYTTNNPGPGNQTLYPRDVQLGLSQPLWTGGRADAAISQADYLVRAERANLMNTEESVLLQATTAYLDVVRDQAVLDLAISNVAVLKKARDEAKAQLAAGIVTKTDLAQAEGGLAQGIAQQRQVEAFLQNSRAAYLKAVGDMPGTLTPPPPVQGLPPSEASAIRQASDRNPQVLGAQANVDAARAGIDLSEAQLMPSLAVNGQLLHANDESISGDQTDSARVLLTLTVPLYQGGAEYSQVRAAKQTYGQRQNEIEAAVRQATLDASTAWQNLEAAQATIESYQAQIDANRIAFQGVVEENRVGTRTLLDVLNAQILLFESQVNLARTQRDEAVSAYQLKAAIGELTALALNLQVERYDPLTHYDAVREQWIGTGPAVP